MYYGNGNQYPPLGGYPPPSHQYPPSHQVINVVCQGHTTKPPFGHGFHVFMDFVTCGLWFPLHILLWILH